MIEIKVDSEALNDLYQYCRKSPAQTPLVMARLVREWYKQTARKWAENPSSIPRMPDIPEKRMTSIGINSAVGRAFKETVERLNRRIDPDIDTIAEEKLASMLLVAYIITFKARQKAKTYDSFGRQKWAAE
jgi:hypothetical protein